MGWLALDAERTIPGPSQDHLKGINGITGWLWNDLNAIVVCVNSETNLWKKNTNHDIFYASVELYIVCI